MKNKNLIAILAASSILAGCNSMGPVRPGIGSSQDYLISNPQASQMDYINHTTQRLTALDAAESDREYRCLKEMDGNFKYETKLDAYNALEQCTLGKRNTDMATYMIGSVVIDGVKLFGLVNGLSGGKLTPQKTPDYNVPGSSFGDGSTQGSSFGNVFQ